jgi:hypothetical protein
VAESPRAWQKSWPIPPGRSGHFPVSQTALLDCWVLKVVNRWSLSFLGLKKDKNNKSQRIVEYLLKTGGQEGATRALVAGKLPVQAHDLEGQQVLVGQVPGSNPVTQLDGHSRIPGHLRHKPEVPLLPVPGLLCGREGFP